MNLFADIKKNHPEITGWCSLYKAMTLASIVVALRPKLCVEIGVWGGRELIPMAMALKQIGVGKVIGIDPWQAKASVMGQVNKADADWWDNQQMHDDVYKRFNEDIARLELKDQVIIHRAASNDVNPPLGIGLLCIDGNHGKQAIEDARGYGWNVSPGGIVVMDDLDWSGGAVLEAVEELKTIGFRELYVVTDDESKNRWGVYQRK